MKRLTNVSEPTISIYSPSKDKANGRAVIVAPGGGYSILAIEHEGTQTCEWLQSLGVTAVLLKYRVPQRDMQTPSNLAAIQDAPACREPRRGARPTELGIDPNRIGMLGFSAGGNLTACMCGGPRSSTSRLTMRTKHPLGRTSPSSSTPAVSLTEAAS